jgi:8-amino-3,8-dideoxy-alpha-D-manno-octulosonate transaminase
MKEVTGIGSGRGTTARRGALAIDGGKPVRTKPLDGPYPGALMMGREEERAAVEVIRSKSLFRYYGPGTPTRALAFEEAFAARIGTRFALGVNSGTSALRTALMAAGVGPGVDVLVPAFSYIATSHEVIACGGRPVFVEVDDSMLIDPTDIENRMTPAARVVTPVHLFGSPADMDRILPVARRLGLRVVEDCAQSCGATYRGRPVGSIGDAGIFSFQLNKLITAGEGGAVCTNDPELQDRAVRHHDHGNYRMPGNIPNPFKGVQTFGENLRMTELTAAILRVQLGRLDDILGRLRYAKRSIVQQIEGLPGVRLASVPDPDGDASAAVMMFAPTVELARRIVAAVQAEGIRVIQQYGGVPMYAAPQMAAAGYRLGQCPRTEDLAGRSIMIGLTTTWSDKDLADVGKAFRKVCSAYFPN